MKKYRLRDINLVVLNFRIFILDLFSFPILMEDTVKNQNYYQISESTD